MGRIVAWLQERVPVSAEQLAELTNEPVPNHLKKWWFCLGGTPAYLFVVQIVTGILLALYYQPSAATAYESIRYITNEATFGWFLRSMHKWAATLMIAAVILHQMRVYFTNAYRRPRELNWIIGMCLLMATLLTGFTGYSLVFEQLSYWGATVAANISDAVPLVGRFAKQMLLGGDEYNARTLSRFYILHAAVLPTTIVLLVVCHIAQVRMHGVTEFPDPQEPPDRPRHFNFFPDHMLSELIIGLVLMIVLCALATVLPASMGPKADPLTTPEVIKPEWFFYVSFRWLKLFSLSFAVISSGFIVGAMFVWPWIDKVLRRITGIEEISVYIGIVATFLLIGLTIWEAAVAH
ncbi:MAG TPA: cytochrome bc complex cytochrome b subunit [Aestuariivirga sp.]|nr:cytochrome bc complex cytochrome b subunit [Aestuariivirga sp.]